MTARQPVGATDSPDENRCTCPHMGTWGHFSTCPSRATQPQPTDAVEAVAAAMASELDEHGYEDDDEKRWMVARHFAEVAITALDKAGCP